jgi:hypothetical protein
MPEAKTTSGGTVQLATNLAAKLAEVMGEMAHVKKEGFNKAQNYRFVRETDVAEKASELLSARHIWIHQTVVEEKMRPLYITASGAQMWLTKVKIAFKFIDGDTKEETEPQIFSGHGADTGDKGVYKAMTGAEKYFLLKSFLVSTGDDPEADEKVDKAAAAAGATTTGPRVVRGNQAGVQRGGKSSTATKAQVDEIARLAKDLNLTPETMQPLIHAVLGHIPADGVKLRDFLGAQKSEDAAKLIAALLEFKPVEPTEEDEEEVVHTESTDVDDEPPPPAMAVV